MSLVVQVFGCRHDDAIHALRRPASEKRQGTKSREVGHWLGSERYGDLMLAPISMMGGALPRCLHAREVERVRRHFGARSERINGRTADWGM
jgi:hypothetical protein